MHALFLIIPKSESLCTTEELVNDCSIIQTGFDVIVQKHREKQISTNNEKVLHHETIKDSLMFCFLFLKESTLTLDR